MALPGSIPTLQAHNSGNYTRVDNVFCTDTLFKCAVTCNMVPSLRPMLTDHLPICTTFDIRIPTVDQREQWCWAKVNWDDFQKRLKELLETLEPLNKLTTETDFWRALREFDEAITKVIMELVPKAKPSPYQRRWWNETLTAMKRWTSTLSVTRLNFG
ncbi:hypothetical protein GG344DRAFT_57879 [Lentinula edodes]|nr:hypothetical protein GG344DRAFT_57879 [Lentinula edodes]